MPKAKGSSPGTAGQLTITAQQSRFHNDAVDNPTSKEIDIRDLNISIGQLEVLSHADLRLRENMKYVFVGRNGTGKTTLLKSIAEQRIPGISPSIRILLLGQTRITTFDEDMENLTTAGISVLEHVLKSDSVKERYLKEAEILSTAMDNSNEPMSIIRAYRQLKHERLGRSTGIAKLIAERRSGMRGLKARKALIASEEELASSETKLDESLGDITPQQLKDETQAASDMLIDIQSQLELEDAESADSRARTVLLGLGFAQEALDNPMSSLSGGWRTRCDLACALFCHSVDVLLLDEPTNFLDLPSIIWLQNYLKELENRTVVVVTHDRDFCDAVGDELIVLREKKLEKFRGNLSLYEAERIAKHKYLTKMQGAQDKQKKHMQQTIDQNVKAAKKHGDDKKLKQSASRQKKLDDRMGMQVNAKGHRFRRNKDLIGKYLTARVSIEDHLPTFDPSVKMNFPTETSDLRFPGSLVSLEKVSFSYSKKKDAKKILEEVDLTIHPGDRVGFAGLNGSGKTTLVSLIVGAAEGTSATPGLETFLPTSGTITRHSRAKIARFSQHVVEELEAIAAANSSLTALTDLLGVAGGAMDEKDARALLGSMGLPGSIAADIPVASLSGGQKVRLALAKLVWQPPHLLVLDEVTTHLDADTISVLISALQEYEGALLVVTHDRYFMRCVVEGEKPEKSTRDMLEDDDDYSDDTSEGEDELKKGVVYRMFKGKLKVLENGMNQYEEIETRASLKLTKRKG